MLDKLAELEKARWKDRLEKLVEFMEANSIVVCPIWTKDHFELKTVEEFQAKLAEIRKG